MKKIKPKNLDVTFCEYALPSGECSRCARNAGRYDMGERRFFSFLYPPREDSSGKCSFFVLDASNHDEDEK